MSLALQAKLLRTLQEQEFEPVGSNQLMRVDVRLIAATSRDLETMVADGEFRADLYYRLNVITLKTPPLRERFGDLQPLAEYLLEEIARRHGMPPCEIDLTALERLRRHDWPGNVRELSNVLERAVLMSDAIVLQAADIERVLPTGRAVQHRAAAPGFAAMVADAEREAIRGALHSTRGNKSQAAKLLGISRAALYEKIAALGIDVRAV